MIASTTRNDRHDASADLAPYLREIQVETLLTAEDERMLAAAIRRGDDEARARMIRANLRLVVKIARDYLGRGLSLDDLVGEGNLGLIKAAEQFDPSFGTRFSTYAAHWIKQSIRHALITTGATIRLPAHAVGLVTKWRRAERALRRELGVDPGFDQIADRLGLTRSRRELVDRALQSARVCREGAARGEDLPMWSADDTHAPHEAPDARLEADEDRLDLLRRMSRLDDRERMVLALRYGLGGVTPLTLKEVGRRLGVTREWVRKIELRAVRKLDDQAEAAPLPEPTRLRMRTRRPFAATA